MEPCETCQEYFSVDELYICEKCNQYVCEDCSSGEGEEIYCPKCETKRLLAGLAGKVPCN
jgi:hypothetical protein